MFINNFIKEKYFSLLMFRIIPSKIAKLKYRDQSFELCLQFCYIYTNQIKVLDTALRIQLEVIIVFTRLPLT